MSLLITGATGYLGRALVHSLSGTGSSKTPSNQLVLLGHSEQKADELMRAYGVPVHIGDISDIFFLESIFRNNKIHKVIHCAAVKYVSVSNKNPIRAVESNVIGSYNLLRVCEKYGIKDVVAISTDKAINPINVYGLTKALMESIFIKENYSVCRGVNFFASDGSVLQIWYNQYLSGKPLTVTDPDCIRYFIEIDKMVELVLNSFGKKGISVPQTVWEVRIGELLEAFCEVYDYSKTKKLGLGKEEKLVEDIDESIEKVPAYKDKLKSLVEREIDKWQSLK